MTSAEQELGPRQRRWLAALRSEKYERGVAALHDMTDDSWCPLGVACDLFADECDVSRTLTDGVYEEFDDERECLPQVIWRHLGLRGCTGASIRTPDVADVTYMNDIEGLSFSEIADLIEADPAAYFTEPL